MNLVTDKLIYGKLQADYKKCLQDFKPSTILGIFAVGSVNFGDAKEISDIESHIITFPTIEDLACGCPFLKIGQLSSAIGGPLHITNFCALFDELNRNGSHIEQIFTTPYFIINPLYQKAFSQLQIDTAQMSDENRWKTSKELKSSFPQEEVVEKFTHLLNTYFQHQDDMQSKLFEALTKTEEKALIFLLECIGSEGIISISETIKASGISRPVYTSLFEKLTRYKSAEVKNMGVKGTYINFYDHILSKFEIN